jgi:hypothetical protein
MGFRRLRRALLAGGGLALMATGPALAQQEECAGRLDQIERQLSRAKLGAQRQSDIRHVIEGARLLAETGDQEGCMNVVTELDQLMATLDETGRLDSAEGSEQEQRDHAVTAEKAQQGERSPIAAMPASAVIGAEVHSQEGDTVAEIVDLVKRPGEQDLFAVLGVGGLLGIGEKHIVVPLNELQVGPNGEIIMRNASVDQLKDMPEYREEGFESMARLEQPPTSQQ